MIDVLRGLQRPFAFAFLMTTVAASAEAQFGTPATPAAPKTPVAEGKPAIIERGPLVLRDAAKFQISLKLEPVKTVRIAPRVDGVVSTISAKLGEKILAQGEVARLESQERQLELSVAQAEQRSVQAERTATTGNALPALDAKAEAAKAAVDLAALRLDYCNLKSPLTGIVTKIHVTEGQFVRAGDPIVTVVDPTKLRVEVPVDSKATAPGAMSPVMIEDQSVTATVEALIPLDDRFNPLRDLFVSVSGAVLLIDNSTGKYRVGQTAYSPMIPRQAVTEVPTSALSNTGDGERKVQVIRDGIVRDIRIQPLGQHGESFVFVAGRFGPTDELVLKSSETLLDGARITSPTGPPTGTTAPKSDVPPARATSF